METKRWQDLGEDDQQAWDLHLLSYAYPKGKKFIFWTCYPRSPLPGRRLSSGGMSLAELPPLAKLVVLPVGEVSSHLKPLEKALHVKTVFL